MSAVLKNFTLPYGDTLPFKLVMSTNEAGEEWIGWADYRLRFTIKNSKSDADSAALVRKTTDVGGGINASGFEAYWEQVTDTGIPAPGAYYYDIQIERTEEPLRVETLQEGYLNLIADVTRAPGS